VPVVGHEAALAAGTLTRDCPGGQPTLPEIMLSRPQINERTQAMRNLRFSIDIEAPMKRVWHVLWDPESFRDWTSVFSEGSDGSAHIRSDWKAGGRFEFFEGEAGSYGIIQDLVPHKSVVFKHLGEIQQGTEHAYDRARLEKYTLQDKESRTTLILEHEVLDEHQSMFEKLTPKAFARLKELAEK
jgi:uncharacterized protein YndB with AHSA1/START domain